MVFQAKLRASTLTKGMIEHPDWSIGALQRLWWFWMANVTNILSLTKNNDRKPFRSLYSGMPQKIVNKTMISFGNATPWGSLCWFCLPCVLLLRSRKCFAGIFKLIMVRIGGLLKLEMPRRTGTQEVLFTAISDFFGFFIPKDVAFFQEGGPAIA